VATYQNSTQQFSAKVTKAHDVYEYFNEILRKRDRAASASGIKLRESRNINLNKEV